MTVKNSIISMFLLSSLLAAVSCGEQSQKETAVTGGLTEPPAQTTEDLTADHLPDTDLQGLEFHILTAAEQWQEFYNSEQTGDLVDDAVYHRNRDIEERFNTKLQFQIYDGYSAGKSLVKTALEGSVMSGGTDFDLMVGSVSYVTPISYLTKDLTDCSYLDFDKPWWYLHVNEEMKLDDQLHFAAGAFGITNTAWACVTYFNKSVQKNFGIEDLYQTVSDHQWTYDHFYTLCQNVTKDLDGNGKIEKEDAYGVISSKDYIQAGILHSMNYHFSERKDHKIIIKDVDERLDTINEKIYTLFHDPCYMNTFGDNGDYTDAMTHFAAGNSLFMIHRLSFAGNDIVRSGDEFGIIPLPMYDEKQDRYYTYIIPEVAGIPLVVKDEEVSALLLEALTAESYRSIRPVYYEKALKVKYTSDDIACNMLDLIFENVYSDFTYCYAGLFKIAPIYEVGNRKNLTSFLAKHTESMQNQLDQFISDLNAAQQQ